MHKTLITILLIIGCVNIAQAETLSLREVMVFGLANNYDLQIAELDVERADAGITGEEGRFDVTAELGINTTRTELPADSTLLTEELLITEQDQLEAALDKQFASGLHSRLSLTGTRSDADSLADRLDSAYRTTLVLDLTQPLLKDRGRDITTANLRISRIAKQQAAYGYLGTVQQLVADIENAYLDLAQSEADYRYSVLARDLASELLDANQRKFDAGLLPITEVNEARTAVAAREEVMILQKQQIAITRNRLLELIDHGHSELPADWRVALPEVDSANGPKLTSALKTGLKKRPDLQQARLELDARKIALVYADNQLLPRLDLEASLGINGLSGDAESNTFYDGPWRDSFDDDGNSWYAGLRFSMPLQNRVAKAQYRDAAALDKQSLYRLRRAEVAAEAAIRSAYETLALGQARLDIARRTAELAETTLEQENRRLEEGLSDTFRVLIFQTSLVDAKINEVAALTDYHRARVRLFQAMGINLESYNIVAALPQQGAML